MNQTIRRLAAPVALLALLAGCSKDEKSDPPKPPQIKLSATALTFDATMAGDPAPAAKTVSITNGGEGTLAKPTATVDFGAGPSWLTAGITGDAAPYTLTVTPSTAVAAGDYSANISLASTGASNTPATVTVAFTVTANPLPVIAVSTSALRFEAETGDPDPAAQTLAITNGGGGTLTDPTVDAIDYGAGPADWLSVSVDVDTDVITVTAHTAPGAVELPRGHYEVTLYVSAFDAADGTTPAYNSPVAIPVAFDVTDPTLAVSPASLAFGVTVGTNPPPRTITVTNSADGTLQLPTAISSAPAWLTATVSGTAAPFTVTVSVDGSVINAGTLTGSVTIDSANASNGPIIVPVTVTAVAATVQCYVAADSVCQELSTTSGASAASFTEGCAADGGSPYCPATPLGPCSGLFGLTSPAYAASAWFYAPEFNAASAQLYCGILEGTWEGPVDGGATHSVSFGCNMPADSMCSDLSGMMTQATEDQWKVLCTDMAGGEVVGSCSTMNRIGTCTYTQSSVTFQDRYYSGSGATAADCSGAGETWTPG